MLGTIPDKGGILSYHADRAGRFANPPYKSTTHIGTRSGNHGGLPLVLCATHSRRYNAKQGCLSEDGCAVSLSTNTSKGCSRTVPTMWCRMGVLSATTFRGQHAVPYNGTTVRQPRWSRGRFQQSARPGMLSSTRGVQMVNLMYP